MCALTGVYFILSLGAGILLVGDLLSRATYSTLKFLGEKNVSGTAGQISASNPLTDAGFLRDIVPLTSPVLRDAIKWIFCIYVYIYLHTYIQNMFLTYELHWLFKLHLRFK